MIVVVVELAGSAAGEVLVIVTADGYEASNSCPAIEGEVVCVSVRVRLKK